MTGAPFDPFEDGATTNFRGRMSYGGYLCLDKLLTAQQPLSSAHDDLQPAFKMLSRVSRIFEQLNSAWDVLRTMTPSEYTQFRATLGQSSGLESHQYRMIEYLVGNKNPAMMRPHEHDSVLLARLDAVRQAPSLYDLTMRALHRRGFTIDEAVLKRDVAVTHVADDSVRAAWATVYHDPLRF